MSKKSELLKLAKSIEEQFAKSQIDPQSIEHDDKLVQLLASTLVGIEKIAEESDVKTTTGQDIEAIAALAQAFDMSGDPGLQAEASYLDEILLAIAAPKAALAGINEVYDKELTELRAKMRSEDRENKYTYPKEKLDEMYGYKAIADAVKKQVNVRRPLQEPLSTRYSPDRPGVSLVRITDRVYQDPTTGKVYDYAAGYTTEKGTEVPGGGVDQQIPDINEHQSRSLFTTREGLLSSADKKDEIKKEAASDDCPKCKGTSTLGPAGEPDGSVFACDECSGTGKKSADPHCPVCRGTGNNGTCAVCFGPHL